MKAINQALAEQHDELDGLLVGLGTADWDRPAPGCPGWTLSDVVLHLAQTCELVVDAAEGTFAAAAAKILGDLDTSGPAAPGLEGAPMGTVDEAVALMVERQRGAPGAEVHARWRAAARAERELFAASDPRRPLPWVVVALPARTLATTRMTETWIHTHDVATALGMKLAPTGRLWHVARLAWRSLPYAFGRAGLAAPGPVAAILTAPGGGRWEFGTDAAPATTVTGPALDFCLVAGRRMAAAQSSLSAEGPDAEQVLALVRTYA